MEVGGTRCHLCSSLSAAVCPLCRRPVCAAHLADFPVELAPAFGPRACTICVERALAQIDKERAQRERKRTGDLPYRTCAVCGQEFPQVLAACAVCGRRICRGHSVRYRRRFRFGHRGDKGAWYWDYDVRCLEHRRRFPRLEGWEVDSV